MTEQYWKEIRDEIDAGTRLADHPFHYATLATVGLEQVPRLRTIVIREFDPGNMQLTFFTDSRSKKMLHIKENNKVSLLYYHPEKLLQLRIEGLAFKEADEDALTAYWDEIREPSRKDYTTQERPGAEIGGPDQVDYMQGSENFAVVRIQPFRIEYLQLRRPNHIRVRFSRSGDSWSGDFLVP